MHVSFEEAQQIIDSAVKKSVELGVKFVSLYSTQAATSKRFYTWLMLGWAAATLSLKKGL